MNRSRLREYVDLLADEQDLRAIRVIASLDALYRRGSAPADLGTRIWGRLAQPSTKSAHASLLGALPSRLQWLVIAAIAALALASTAAVALSPVLERLWDQEGTLASLERAGLIERLQLRETVGDVTIVLRRGYADPHRIVLGYTIEVPTSRGLRGSSAAVHPTLTDSAGRTYRRFVAQSASEERLGDTAHVVTFEGDGLPLRGGEVGLKLVIPEVTLIHTDKSRPGGTDLAGPWSFSFTLTVQPARSLSKPLAARAGDQTIHLLDAVTAPSGTHLRMRLDSDSRTGSWNHTAVQLVVGGRRYAPTWLRCVDTGSCNETIFGFAHIPSGAQGEWRLVVSEIVGASEPDKRGLDRRSIGPWSIPFTPR
jgi:hypothetical protein